MADLAARFAADGFVVFDADPRVARWATRAHGLAVAATHNPVLQAQWLRHGETWFVGVDALRNDQSGAVDGAPLAGPWEGMVRPPAAWHCAQVSVVYPGYPRQDAGDSDAAHAFRVRRCAAHVDGLHLEQGRRIVREPHAFILGLPLNDSSACPLVVWRGSHRMMRDALANKIGAEDPVGADVTEVYTATRARIFDGYTPIEVHLRPGQAVLVDRHAVHGVAPWKEGDRAPDEGRIMAYFRPQFEDAGDWLLG